MKTGRPRKSGVDRYPCGKAKKPTLEQLAAAQRAAMEVEMQVVLAQPHRRGNRSQLAESPLGRFCEAHRCPREYFDAGEDYGAMKRRWRAAVGAPMIDRLGGNGGDIESETVRKWAELIKAWERAMLDGGGYLGRLSVISLIMDRPTIQPKIYTQEAKMALYALAKYQGRMK
jgi:hypothetical protein